MNSLKPSSPKYIGEAALLLVAVFWGATFVVVKESLNDVSPLIFITLRFSVAAVLLLPFLIFKRDLFTKQAITAGVLLGIFLFLGFSTQTAGLKLTTATRSGFITGTIVVIVPFLQFIIKKRPPTRGAIIGAVLVFAGLFFLSSGSTSVFSLLSELGSNFNFGDMLTLVCAFFFALHVVYIDILTKKHNFWALVLVQLITVALLSLTTSFIFDVSSIEKIKLIPTEYLIFGILYTGIFATLINLILQTKYQKEVSPTKAGIIYSFEPIFAATFAFFLLNEKITNFGFIGAALIFLGLIVAETYETLVLKYGRVKKS